MSGQERVIERAVRGVLGEAFHELSPLGFYCRRDELDPAALPRLEAILLEHGPLRVFDFQMGRPEDLQENAIAREGADPADYRGVLRGPHRVFRVDHHHRLPDLRGRSATPLALRWLQGLWSAGEHVLLAEVARARYLADHCDPDILLAHHLALQAEREEYLHGPVGEWLSAAALRNDYIRLPPDALEPEASRVYYATLGIEAAIESGALTFAESQLRWLPALEGWLAGRGDPADTRRLDAWEDERRRHEQAILDRIHRWRTEGCWQEAAGGRAVLLDAPEKIDNAELFLYVVSRLPRSQRPAVQLLRYPNPDGSWTFKLRSHDGFDLNPLYEVLNRSLPGARFGGRAAAGGSRPTDAVQAGDVLAEIARTFD